MFRKSNTFAPQAQVDGEWVAFEPSGEKKYLLAHCHVNEEPLTDELKAQFPADSVFQGLSKVVLMEPESPHGNGDNCICNSGTAPVVVTLLFMFSVCVQAAEGLSFGIVPYISRPALGVVSGMVGAGGKAVGVEHVPQLVRAEPRTLPTHLAHVGSHRLRDPRRATAHALPPS